MNIRLLATGTLLMLSGMLYAQPGPAKALHFDGVDDFVQAPYQPYFNEVKTIELRVKPDLLTSNACIVASRDASNTLFSVHMTNGTIGLWNGAEYLTVPYEFQAGTWYHITLRFTPSSMEVSVNNVYIGATMNTMSHHDNLGLSIGSPFPYASGELFKGTIDDIRFWNYHRAPEEIAAEMNSSLAGTEAGLLANYTFNSGLSEQDNSAETTAADESPNHNNGTLTNFSLNGPGSNWVDGAGEITAPAAGVPVIDHIFPLSGPVGSEVTIDGNNFNTVAGKNIVYFGAVRAQVTYASKHSLRVTVPVSASYAPITVTNVDAGLTARAKSPFMITFDHIPMEFGHNEWSSFYSNPGGVIYGDLDGDGKPDQVVGSEQEQGISVYRNVAQRGRKIESMSFWHTATIPTNGFPTGLSFIDINGDGKLDIIGTINNTSQAVILINATETGETITFNAPVFVSAPVQHPIIKVLSGDVNSDGKPGLVMLTPNEIVISENIGDRQNISFEYRYTQSLPGIAVDLVVTDLDGDRRPDIVVANQASNEVLVFRNQTGENIISLARAQQFAVGEGVGNVIAADINMDGAPELITSNRLASTLSVLNNKSVEGEIFFENSVDIPMPKGTVYVTAGDITGDGRPEVLNSNAFDYSFTVFDNNFSPWAPFNANDWYSHREFFVRQKTDQLAIVDLDGDGRQDVAALSIEPLWDNLANYYINYLHYGVIINNKPVVYDVYPLSAKPGATVEITGNRFSYDPGKNLVQFGGVKAEVISSNENHITVIVPAGAMHAQVSVLNTENGLTGISAYKFIPSIGASTLAFSAETKVITSGQPTGFKAADIDGDGNTDLIFGNAFGEYSSVFRNNGDNTVAFGNESIHFGMSPLTSFATADFNGDGRPDILQSNGDMLANIRYNNSFPGNTDFQASASAATTDHTKMFATADVDGNGMMDFASIDPKYGTINITLNNSTPHQPSFSTLYPLTGIRSPISFAFADLNQDQRPDLIVTDDEGMVYMFYNYVTEPGYVEFHLEQQVQLSGRAGELATGDLNGDGTPEIVIAIPENGLVSVLSRSEYMLQNYFPTIVEYAVGDFPEGLALGDMNGDGLLDIVVSNQANNTISVLANRSTINSFSFAGRQIFAGGVAPGAIQLADFNQDGRTDIAVANMDESSISILTNTGTFLVLPVTLSDFTATKKSKEVLLNWSTRSESNSSRFEVERSGNGHEFKTIGSLKAAGTSSVLNQYSLTDASPVKGVNYYRIKSVDADGKTAYSSVAAITWETTTATVAITLAPQPLESVMTVSITGNIGDAQFTVYDISGKPVHNVQFNGNKQFSINKGKMAAGIYVYKLTNRAGKILAIGKLMVR